MTFFNLGLCLGCWAAAGYCLSLGQPALFLAYIGFGIGYLGLAVL